MGFFSRKDSTPPAVASPARQERGRAARVAGYDAEGMAAQYLLDQGVQVLTRNFRCKSGEIDLVGKEGDVLIFAEVRLRIHAGFGGPAESITASKRRRIALAANFWLLQNPRFGNHPCRFDCVLMTGPTSIEWIRDAFRLD